MPRRLTLADRWRRLLRWVFGRGQKRTATPRPPLRSRLAAEPFRPLPADQWPTLPPLCLYVQLHCPQLN